jgi:aminoglycoside phosphotransferase (APT) family kinase protein
MPSPRSDTGLGDAAALDRLARFLAAGMGASSARIVEARRLTGGAVQENWLLRVTLRGGASDVEELVLRTDAPTGLGIGLTRGAEFAVLRAVRAAGVAAPEPLLLCEDTGIIGRPFLIMRRCFGSAAPAAIVAGKAGGSQEALAARLGRELALIHGIRPPCLGLAGLGEVPGDAARTRLHQYRALLDADDDAHPVAEWGLRWLEHNRPEPMAPVLVHGDFRTGNFLVDAQGLSAILDWEFAAWGEPEEDIGWFCLRCWRFGAFAREAGGIASRAAFYAGYEQAGGRPVDARRVQFWEVMAALRWLVIALRQRDRFLRGGEASLDLALTGRRVAECEMEILRLTGAAERAA